MIVKQHVRRLFTVVYLFTVLSASDSIVRVFVPFDGWRHDNSYTKSVTGRITYRFYFKGYAGETLRARLSTWSDEVYMNLYYLDGKKESDAFFVGMQEGDVMKRKLQADGSYLVEVYMLRDALHLDKEESFTLYLSKE